MRTPILVPIIVALMSCGGGGGKADHGTLDPGTDLPAQDEGVTPDIQPQDWPPVDPGPPDVPQDDDVDSQPEVIPDIPADIGPPELAWAQCDTKEWPVGYPKPPAAVECAFLDVSLDRAKPDGEKVTLRLGRHKSKKFPTGKAVFNLAGGPGGTSVGQSGTIPLIMPGLLSDFDMVYVDQRGTGGSGYMDCPGGYPETQAGWEACAAKYKAMDRTHYLTVDAADDLDDARKAMGYGEIYLRGGSYGTRLGLEFMRRHPDSVAGVVLDGLCTPDTDLFGFDVEAMDHGVDLLVTDCKADPACRDIVPDLGKDMLARLELLKTKPHVVKVGGQEMAEDAEVFKYLLSAFLYTAKWRFKIPRAVHESLAGDNTKWNALISEVAGAPVTDADNRSPGPFPRIPRPAAARGTPWRAMEYVAPGVLATIACTEWMPNSEGIEALEAKLAKQTWGMDSMLDLPHSCPGWTVGLMDPEVLKPVKSDLAALLLSGAIDLNTPVEWGVHALDTLPEATHIVVPFATHSTMQVPCVADVIAAYFQVGCDIEKISTKCVGEIPSPGW